MIYIIPTVGQITLVFKTEAHKRDLLKFLDDAIAHGCGEKWNRLAELVGSHLAILDAMPEDQRAGLTAAEQDDRRRAERAS